MKPDRSALLPKTVLFAAGDPGGANAVLPVLRALAQQALISYAVLDHGPLAQGLSAHVPLTDGSCPFDTICLGTSLADAVPLSLARSALAQGRRVVVVLDNWVNYRSRLATDGLPPLIPHIYAVMDDKARTEAIQQGIPPDCLFVTGHPNLAELHTESQRDFTYIRQALGMGLGGRELVVFINEPVSTDQGTNSDHPLWRGYTQADALAALALGLTGRPVDVAIIPHPRDDVGQVTELWDQLRGDCSGRLVTEFSGRHLVLAADRVAGMASILLYESWLLGKPTLSLQPNLVREDLLSIASRPGVHLMRGISMDPVSDWLHQGYSLPQADLLRHAGAAERITELLF